MADDIDKLDLDEAFTPVEDDDEVVVNQSIEDDEDSCPKITDPDWTDYVLGLLTDDEKVNGRPRTEGLLRVSRVLGFPIKFDRPRVHYATPESASITCYAFCGADAYHGSAECSILNTDEPYNKYPLATAETRAIGRVVKRILNLNVLTAEETSKVADLTIPASDENRTEGSIVNTQIKFIERMCSKLDLDVQKVVIDTVGEHDKITELSHAEALEINKQLDHLSKEKDEKVLEALGPFNTDWRSDFI